MGDDVGATTICPVRFLEGGRMFVDAGRAAFGLGRQIVVAPEMRILHVPRTGKRIGKIDFVIAALDAHGHATDFAALEVQSVYISGLSIRPAFNEYLATGHYAAIQRNRPDYRSSAQKRLMPQLSLKVPVFRRWGKKFFVVVDAAFYAAMPPIREVSSVENSEVTWLVYPLPRTPGGCRLHPRRTPRRLHSMGRRPQRPAGRRSARAKRSAGRNRNEARAAATIHDVAICFSLPS